MTGLKDEGKEFLGKVVSYEDESGKFRSWLTEKKDILENLAPPCSSVEEIQKQLNQVLVRDICSAGLMASIVTTPCCTVYMSMVFMHAHVLYPCNQVMHCL